MLDGAPPQHHTIHNYYDTTMTMTMNPTMMPMINNNDDNDDDDFFEF